MEFIANDIKQQLDKLTAVISAKGLIEDSDKIVFDREGMYAFNGEIFVAVLFKTPFFGSVEGSLFCRLISKYGSNKIDIEENGDKLVITKGRSEVEVPFDHEVNCPIDLTVDKWKKLPADFLECINLAAYTTGKDYSDMRTVCIHVVDNICESSDVMRISVIEAKNKIEDELFIPNDALTFFNKCKPVHYFVQNNWVYYEDLEGTMILHREITFDREYPKLKQMVESLTGMKEIELPEKLYDSLERASALFDKSSEGDRVVNFECKDNKLRLYVTAKNTGGASYKDELRIDFDGELYFAINPAFMMQIMEKSNKVQVNDNAIKITTGNSTYVTCLMEAPPAPKKSKKEDGQE